MGQKFDRNVRRYVVRFVFLEQLSVVWWIVQRVDTWCSPFGAFGGCNGTACSEGDVAYAVDDGVAVDVLVLVS